MPSLWLCRFSAAWVSACLRRAPKTRLDADVSTAFELYRDGELAHAILGQIGPGDTTPEFETALIDLAPGDVSAPVETRYGVHLIRLARRIDGSPLPFETVRERVAAYLVDHVRRQALAQYISLLVGRADISGIEISGSPSPLVQ